MAENGSSNDPKMKNFNIRFNFSWLYIILILGIGYLLLNNKGANPQKVEWPEVQEMVRAGDVKEITYIRNDYRGSVTMRPDRQGHYLMRYTPICEDASKMSVQEMMDRYYKLLEEDIRKQPENYLWTHQRFARI